MNDFSKQELSKTGEAKQGYMIETDFNSDTQEEKDMNMDLDLMPRDLNQELEAVSRRSSLSSANSSEGRPNYMSEEQVKKRKIAKDKFFVSKGNIASLRLKLGSNLESVVLTTDDSSSHSSKLKAFKKQISNHF